jgi:large subunit ribosomal protein L6
MSRIGKLPILVPENLNIKILDQNIEVSGPYGKLSQKISNLISLEYENNLIYLKKKKDSRSARELFGLSRTLINNMIIGVSKRFEKILIIKGVGYRSQLNGKILVLNLGYSHSINISQPEGIEISVEANTRIILRGIDKELVGQLASKIRNKRPPEPYKGKGISYQDEIIKRKVGKTGK